MKSLRRKWLGRLLRSRRSSQILNQERQELTSDVNQSSSATTANQMSADHASVTITAEVSDSSINGELRSDLWSRAYHEAVSNLTGDDRSRIPTVQNIEQLLQGLEKANQIGSTSFFRKGLAQLRGPLQGLKLALDIAKPLSTVEPIASVAVGVVSGVTAIAIAVCGAEENFNDRIVNMLQQIPVIDECDLLGQKLGVDSGIYKALVPVYQDLLEFYMAASRILNSKIFLISALRHDLSNSLPSIVDSFLSHISSLKFRIENATLELVEQIRKQLLETKIQKILGIDKERQRSNLNISIRDSCAEAACRWLDVDPRFLEWHSRPGSGCIVLFGDMGSGKTYTTGYVVEKLRILNTHQLPRYLLCYHYCSDKEASNAVYIYASLILQLLNQQKALMVDFDKWYQVTKDQELIDPAHSMVALETFVTNCIRSIDRQVFVIIDGLDECSMDSQKRLASFFKNLSATTQRTKVFVSARPTRMITQIFSDSPCIILKPDPSRDQIVARHAIEKHLFELEPDGQVTLLETLSRLADGNVQWIMVIVELVETKGITTKSGISAFLKDLPNLTKLARVYARAFAQATAGDTENNKLLTSALEILAVVQRPLNIQELTAAVTLAGSGEKLHRVDELQNIMDPGRILRLLQPFLSQIDPTDTKKRQIRLRHSSLKELVWREAPSAWDRMDNDTRLSDDRVKHRQAQLEGNILQICVKYLLFEEIDVYDLIPEEFRMALDWQHLPEADIFTAPDGSPLQISSPQAYDAAVNAEMVFFDPAESGLGFFFAYASCFWCEHLRVAAEEHLPDVRDLVRLCRVGSKRLENWTEQQLYPDCTFRWSSGFDSNDLDALAILSLSESRSALRSLLQTSDLNRQDFLDDSVKRAFDKLGHVGSPSIISLIFEYRGMAPDFPTFDFLYALMLAWKRSEGSSTRTNQWFDVIHNMFETFIDGKWGTTLLCAAIKFDCLPVIKILLDEAKRNHALKDEMLEHSGLPSNTRGYKSFMLDAVQYGSCETLDYLLGQEMVQSDLRRLDEKQSNIYHTAALQDNVEKMALLIRAWSEGAHQVNNSGDAPLNIAVFGNHTRVARELLTTAAVDVRGGHKAKGSAWEIPLRTAIRARNLAMCRLLLEEGSADPWTALEIGQDGEICLIDMQPDSSSILNLLRTFADRNPSAHAA